VAGRATSEIFVNGIDLNGAAFLKVRAVTSFLPRDAAACKAPYIECNKGNR